MLISIILPIHNQADHIKEIVQGYLNALPGTAKNYEFILVPNACTDNSPSVCQTLADSNPNIKVILTKKAGWGNAVKLGLQAATGDLICYTNSARTSPEILCRIIEYSLAIPNVVVEANRKIRD